jgi:hypothetical protein
MTRKNRKGKHGKLQSLEAKVNKIERDELPKPFVVGTKK